jgi:hypothetical protein
MLYAMETQRRRIHNKVDKLTLISKSLAISTTKAKKQISDNRHQKEVGIDTYMKATAIEGLKRSLQTDYILKVKRSCPQ